MIHVVFSASTISTSSEISQISTFISYCILFRMHNTNNVKKSMFKVLETALTSPDYECNSFYLVLIFVLNAIYTLSIIRMRFLYNNCISDFVYSINERKKPTNCRISIWKTFERHIQIYGLNREDIIIFASCMWIF